MDKNWMGAVIRPYATVRNALEIIDSEALRVALVVDDEYSLVGVVTDGDIRRGLLNGLGLDSSVEQVMNSSPITACVSTEKPILIEKMKELDVLFIPLIEDTKLVGLETLHHALINKPRHENPIFIMAGGFGTRLKPLTDNCPKPMLKVGERPILETVIRSFIKAGFVNFYISTHYMPEKIHDYFGDGSELGINIIYVHEEKPLGTGGALGLLPKHLELPLIMINGDVLTNVDFQKLLDFHNVSNASATMCVREYDYQIPFGVITGEGNKITGMVEKPTHRFFVNAGIYVVSPKIYRSVPSEHKIDMPTLLEQHMFQNENILMFPIHEYWLDIGRMDDFKKAQIDILSLEN